MRFLGGILLIMLLAAGCKIGAGSYSNAYVYDLNMQEDNLIRVVTKFKLDHNYVLPDSIPFSDGRGTGQFNSFWYYIYFYFPNDNKIFFTWLQSVDSSNTTFGFVSVYEDGHWKDVNQDFGFFENLKHIKEFQDRILVPIKQKFKPE